MNFDRLSGSDLREFLAWGHSTYNIQTDTGTLSEQAEQLWNKLQSYSNVTYPYPVYDLYIAENYSSSDLPYYHVDQIMNLGSEQITPFIEEFNLNPADLQTN